MSHADGEFYYLFHKLVAGDWTASLTLARVRDFLYSPNSLHGLYRMAGRTNDALSVPLPRLLVAAASRIDSTYCDLPVVTPNCRIAIERAYRITSSRSFTSQFDRPFINVPHIMMNLVSSSSSGAKAVATADDLYCVLSQIAASHNGFEFGPSPMPLFQIRVIKGSDGMDEMEDSDDDNDDEDSGAEVTSGNGVTRSFISAFFHHLVTHFNSLPGLCHAPLADEAPFMLLQDILALECLPPGALSALLDLALTARSAGAVANFPISPAELEASTCATGVVVPFDREGDWVTQVSPVDQALRLAVHAHCIRAFSSPAAGAPGSIPVTSPTEVMAAAMFSGDACRSVGSALLKKMSGHTPAVGHADWNTAADLGSIRTRGSTIPYDMCQPFAASVFTIPAAFQSLPPYFLAKYAFLAPGNTATSMSLAALVLESLRVTLHTHKDVDDDNAMSIFVSLDDDDDTDPKALGDDFYRPTIDLKTGIQALYTKKTDPDSMDVDGEDSIVRVTRYSILSCGSREDESAIDRVMQDVGEAPRVVAYITKQVYVAEAIRHFICRASEDTLRKFLFFCTGWTNPSVRGCIDIRFCDRDSSALPTSSSCMQLLSVPLYNYASFCKPRDYDCCPGDVEEEDPDIAWQAFLTHVSSKIMVAIEHGNMTRA